MKIPSADCISLLQRCETLALATHAQAVPGYPFVTVLPFATDCSHQPWLLMSTLAEHCRNVRADDRVSLLLQQPGVPVLQGERMTLVGELQAAEPEAAVRTRLLRYCPEFADYLQLGDFRFFRFQLQRVRFIGGFGRMGWLDAGAWQDVPVLTASAEAELVTILSGELAESASPLVLLGLDALGLDVRQDGVRQRLSFAAAVPPAQLLHSARQCLSLC